MSHAATVVALALASLLASSCCSGPEPERPSVASITPGDAEEAALAARFGAVALPFTGFAAAEADGEWRVGDELLYGVELEDGGERHIWMLGLRVESLPFEQGRLMMLVGDGMDGPHDPETVPVGLYRGSEFSIELTDDRGRKWGFSSDSILISARTHDERGAQVSRQVSVVPATFLDGGFTEACDLALSSADIEIPLGELSDEEAQVRSRAFAGAVAAMLALFRTLEENETMADILWRVVERPSIWSIAVRRGVEVGIEPLFGEIAIEDRTFPALGPLEAARRFPVDLEVNDRLALRGVLGIVDSGAPLRVGAGVIAIDGQHPRDPGRRVRVRLLASRRGAPSKGDESAPE